MRSKHRMARWRDIGIQSISVGISEGVTIGIKILLIMLPISFFVTLLKAVGFIDTVGHALSPYGQYVGLHGASVVAYLTGVLVNCYSAIAIIITLSLSQKELTIIALMLLLCHTLPIEIPIQKKAGASVLLMLGVRVISSLSAGAILQGLLPGETNVSNTVPISSQALALHKVVLQWATDSVITIGKLLLMVILFMILHQLLERSGSLVKLSQMTAPLMKILGLSEKVAFSWLIANVFGLIYGAGIIEAQKSRIQLDPTERQALHVSLSTCHAVIQETLIFFAIGAPIMWIVAPRVLISFILVWGYRLLVKFRPYRGQRLSSVSEGS
jgi:hypothetical protein